MPKRMTATRKMERIIGEIEDLPDYIRDLQEQVEDRFRQVLLETHAQEVEKLIKYLEDLQKNIVKVLDKKAG